MQSPDINAIAFLGLILVVPIVYGIWLYRRGPYSLWECILYAPVYCVCRLLWRAESMNQPALAPGQGAVLIANHRSSIDPLFLQLTANRRIHWMVAKEYCNAPIIGTWLRWVQVIPTNRGGMDTAATKLAIKYAQKGDLVGMFPEGRINRTKNLMLSMRPGAALVAMRAGVPLLPCHIAGSPMGTTVLSPLHSPARVQVTYGDPIQPPPDPEGEKKDHTAAAEFFGKAIKELARVANQPDFQPVIAGRKWVDEA